MSRHRTSGDIQTIIVGTLVSHVNEGTPKDIRLAGVEVMRVIANLTIKELKDIKQYYIPPISEVEYEEEKLPV